MPGFPEGIAGLDLFERMQRQARQFGARITQDTVTKIRSTGEGYEVTSGQGIASARTVLLATGVEVADPEIDELDEAIAHGWIRYCPICDGFEMKDRRVAVLGGRPRAIEEARFLRTYTGDVTYLAVSERSKPSEQDVKRAQSEGIVIEARAPTKLSLGRPGIRLSFAGGASEHFDALYPCLGTSPRSELVRDLGVNTSPDGGVLCDPHHQTSVRGIFAAGDVLQGLDQVASACGHAAIAATAIHNQLRQ